MTLFGPPPLFCAVLAVGVAVVIIALYAVKWRLPRRVVGTVRFWVATQTSGDRAGRLGRLEHLLSVLLQLLIAFSLVGAIAMPRFSCQSAGGRHVVIVLDRSASMSAVDGIEPRIARARRRVIERLDDAAANDRIGLVLAGGQPTIAAPLGIDRGPLRAASARTPIVTGPGRLAEAVARGCSLLAGLAPASLVIITDGSAPTGECPDADVELDTVGGEQANAGIVAFDVAVPPYDPRRAEAYVEVLNASTTNAQLELRLDLEGSLIRVAPLSIGPGERARQVFADLPLVAARGGRQLIAHLERIRFADGRKDGLADDDRAYALLPRRAQIAIDLIGRSVPLELALQSNPRYAVSRRSAPSGAADLTVIVGAPPAPLGRGRFLLVDPQGPNAPITVGERLPSPAISRWRDDHPILRGAILSDVLVGEASRLSLPATAVPLVASAETPLVFALEDEGRRVVGVGFPLESSNLPLRVGFPVMIYNAIDWLLDRSATATSSWTVASSAPVTVEAPGQRPRRVQPVDGVVTVEPTSAGFYRVIADGKPVAEWARSITDAGETRISGGSVRSPAKKAGRFRDREPSRALLLLAAALLLVEWMTFHRRRTV